jgi:hypothetical protein
MTEGQFRNDIDRVEEIARLALSHASGGSPPNGPAGGALTGTFPNPGVNVGAGASVTGVLPVANGGSSSPFAGPLTAPANSSWTQATWFIDPQNVQGTSSDNNDGLTLATALRTYREVTRRWGTTSPVIAQLTTITFLSSHTDNSDPVVCKPILNGNGLIIQGTSPTVIATGVVLSGTVQKSRVAGANSLLITNIGGLAAAGMLIQNTDHPSRAWAYKSLGGGSFEMTQPYALNLPPGVIPAQVNAWVDGDHVNVLVPISVNIVDTSFTRADFGAGFTGRLWLYQLTIFEPHAANNVNISTVLMSECRVNKNFISNGPLVATIINCYCAAGCQILGGGVTFLGGTKAVGLFNFQAGTNLLDGDAILGGTMAYTGSTLRWGFVYIDANIVVESGDIDFSNQISGGHVVYGRTGMTINLQGEVHAFNGNGSTFTAAFTFPTAIATGFLLNGSPTGTAFDGTATLAGGRATTVANLDATFGAGGFGPVGAFNLGGASISSSN